MKKTYQNPEIKIFRVQTAQKIAASSLGVYGDAQGSTMLSREQDGSLWDDDDF